MNAAILDNYGSAQDALEHLCDTLVTEEAYFDLFADEQQAFHDWAFDNAADYLDDGTIDWIGAFYDWREL